MRKARLAAAVHPPVARFQVAKRRGRLHLRLAGEKVDPRQLRHRTLEALNRRLRAARAQAGKRRLRLGDSAHEHAVVRAAVEEAPDLGELVGAARLQFKRHGEAARRANIGFDFRERRCIGAVGQGIDTVAQDAAAGFLERPPQAHAQR